VAWYGDKGPSYTYSGLTLKSPGWTPFLKLLKNTIQRDIGTNFNSVLANDYKNGLHNMGCCRDNEPELGKNPVIVSLSLGETRPFLFRPTVNNPGIKSQKIDLKNGSLLLMKGSFQENWQHRLSPTKRDVGGRINLTFRKILN